ncbi:hypothetical protein BDZ89DRAFT_300528 [Hymenopellis radicata]|nr:hypothetical protein BDZ89DRAFT_300528 [Hymenopellis radicata]
MSVSLKHVMVLCAYQCSVLAFGCWRRALGDACRLSFVDGDDNMTGRRQSGGGELSTVTAFLSSSIILPRESQQGIICPLRHCRSMCSNAPLGTTVRDEWMEPHRHAPKGAT